MVYILRKELTSTQIEELHKALSLIFVFENLTDEDIKNALDLKNDDFEDAVQIQTAYRIGADYILTRNVKDYLISNIPAYTPLEFLERIQGTI
jgi:predicted nucleic acid-binding protein